MKTLLGTMYVIAFWGLSSGFVIADMTITSTCTQWPAFNISSGSGTSWTQNPLLMNSTTNTTSIQTPATTVSDSTYRTTDIEEPASVILNETGYSASATASESTVYSPYMNSYYVDFDHLTSALSSNMPNSTTTTHSLFWQRILFIDWTATDTGYSDYILELSAPLHSYITCNVSNPGQLATASVTHRLSMDFYVSGVLVDEVETTTIFNFTEQNYQNYDLTIPFTYTGSFTSPQVTCDLRTELIATIQIPEPATLLLLALGSLALRKNKN